MHTTVNFSVFCDAFNRFTDRKDAFSYDGKRALFDYLTDLEADTGENIELDVIALCCEYNEYDSAIEAADEYQEFDSGMTEALALAYLQDKTTVIKLPKGGVIIQAF